MTEQIPASLIEIIKLEQLGPNRIRMLNEELNIKSIEDLRRASEKGDIEKLEGFGKKTTENILREIEE